MPHSVLNVRVKEEQGTFRFHMVCERRNRLEKDKNETKTRLKSICKHWKQDPVVDMNGVVLVRQVEWYMSALKYWLDADRWKIAGKAVQYLHSGSDATDNQYLVTLFGGQWVWLMVNEDERAVVILFCSKPVWETRWYYWVQNRIFYSFFFILLLLLFSLLLKE